jgi:pimeloyl-ACP methyl ester carboxylesterase
MPVLHATDGSTKRTIVVILPFGLPIHAAEALCTRLARDVNVITWQGRSLTDDAVVSDDTVLTPANHVRDVEALLDWADIECCHIVGFCSGAGIALLAAAGLPQRIDRLALVCGEFMLDPAQCALSGFQQDVDRLLPLAAQSPDIAQMLSDKLSSGSNRTDEQSEFDEDLALPFKTGPYLHQHGLNYIKYKAVDFTEVAATVAHPTLMITTDDDRQVFPQNSRIVGSKLPNLRAHVTFPGDHYEILRADNVLNDTIVDFLR